MDSYLGSDGQKGSDGQIFYKMANLDDRIKKRVLPLHPSLRCLFPRRDQADPLLRDLAARTR